MNLEITDSAGHRLAGISGEEELHLIYKAQYKEGDCIRVSIEQKNAYYYVQLDDARGASIVYLTDDLCYEIPFGEKRSALSPKEFAGDLHLLHIRKAKAFEYEAYRNLAANVYDNHKNTSCYPHASANVETRGEAVFAAANAIDTVTASTGHGAWPFSSWGINRRSDAAIRIDFGRKVEVDRLILYTRADFPHDNYWTEGRVTFSDGSDVTLSLRKTKEAQEFEIPARSVTWLELGKLKASGDPSPFPALTQIEVYGK